MEEQIVQDKKENRGRIIQIIFLILMLIAIVSLIKATITIYKYKDMLSNPMGYNMKEFGLEYCSCQNSMGQYVNINAIGNNQTSINISDFISCPTTDFNLTKFNFEME